MITENQIKSALKKAAESDKRLELKDDGPRGAGRLVLTVRRMKHAVAAEWFAVYYRDTKRKMTKLGGYPALSIVDARKLFREQYAPAISAGGEIEPSVFRKRSSVTPREATVKALFEAYISSLVAAGKRSADYAKNILLSETNGAARKIGPDRLAAAVTPQHIVPHLSDIYDRGSTVMASIVRAYISAAFQFGIMSANSYTSSKDIVDWGLTSNPVKAIPADSSAHRAGDRFLSASEFRRFWEWLVGQDAGSRVARALRFQMATGQRVEECLRLNKSGFNETDSTFFWDKTKNTMPHLLPLGQHALEIVGDLIPNRHGLYFPNRADHSLPADNSSVRRLTRTFCSKTGVPYFTPRDLRRTWKTHAGKAGISKEVRDRLQNHAGKDVSSVHYDRYDYLPEKRAAVATWDTYMTRILAGEFDDAKPAQVISIEAAA